MKKIPKRMCVCCRQMKDKKDLIRVVNSDGQIVVDYTGKINGRGVYVCKEQKCICDLNKKKVFDKIFKLQVADNLYLEVEKASKNYE